MTDLAAAAAQELRGLLGPGQVLTEEPMAAHCSFRTGGPADLFLQVRTEEELRGTLRFLREAELPVFLLGRGTNLLVSDAGYRGAVVTMTSASQRTPFTGISVFPEEGILRAGAGASLRDIAMAAKESALAGMEFAAGIPGTLGGAILMNAGAYGGEMKQVVRSVRLMTREGQILEKSGEEMQFGYRTSLLKAEPMVVLSADLVLQEGDKAEIAEKIADLGRQRADKQPLEYPSAGSTFKRPEGLFAGKLIMDAGLRGFSVGDAQVSEKHCGFVINRGNASSSEIYRLIEEIRRVVLEASGVNLEREVILLGEF